MVVTYNNTKILMLKITVNRNEIEPNDKRRDIMNILRAPKDLVRRVESEPLNSTYRSDFMRDRDRIMYSSSFRRLDGKTQIYLTGENDHRRIFSIIQLVPRFFKFRYFQSVPESQGSFVP